MIAVRNQRVRHGNMTYTAFQALGHGSSVNFGPVAVAVGSSVVPVAVAVASRVSLLPVASVVAPSVPESVTAVVPSAVGAAVAACYPSEGIGTAGLFVLVAQPVDAARVPTELLLDPVVGTIAVVLDRVLCVLAGLPLLLHLRRRDVVALSAVILRRGAVGKAEQQRREDGSLTS